MKKIILTSIAMLLLLFSCNTTKLPATEEETLLTGFTIDLNTMPIGTSSSKIKTYLNEDELSELGIKIEKSVNKVLEKNNLVSIKNRSLTNNVDIMSGFPNKNYWVHSDTTNTTPIYFRRNIMSKILGFNAKNHLRKVKGNSDLKYFTYAYTYLADNIKYPHLHLQITTVDQNGKIVLNRDFSGKGKKKEGFTKENIHYALEVALEDLQ